jgi:hypothetical protein
MHRAEVVYQPPRLRGSQLEQTDNSNVALLSNDPAHNSEIGPSCVRSCQRRLRIGQSGTPHSRTRRLFHSGDATGFPTHHRIRMADRLE